MDGAVIKNIAENNGYQITQDPKKADIIIFNTCAFKKKQEDLCLRTIKKYQEIKKEGADLVVCGCLVSINKHSLESVFDGVSFAPTNLEKIFDVLELAQSQIEDAKQVPRVIADYEMFGTRAYVEKIYDLKKYLKKKLHLTILPKFDLHDYIGDENTLYLRISRGCLNQCGYCAIRYAQGKLISQPMMAVLDAVRKGVSDGYEKVFLVGTNTSHYGRDIGTSFYDLLENILKIEGKYRIIIHNFEPFGLQENPSRFLKSFSSSKILSFYFPINSGSQRVLERMRRHYDIEKVMAILRQLRKLNQDILIRSEFIVGYPGERWGDFFKTVRLIRKFKFNQVELHRFSLRPNTYAESLDGHVSAFIKYLRFWMILVVVFAKVTMRKLRPI
jgi:tRNA-2-methylthio-N6-dimethylallyladenosine synthase